MIIGNNNLYFRYSEEQSGKMGCPKLGLTACMVFLISTYCDAAPQAGNASIIADISFLSGSFIQVNKWY
jgi:hypothetical protein